VRVPHRHTAPRCGRWLRRGARDHVAMRGSRARPPEADPGGRARLALLILSDDLPHHPVNDYCPPGVLGAPWIPPGGTATTRHAGAHHFGHRTPCHPITPRMGTPDTQPSAWIRRQRSIRVYRKRFCAFGNFALTALTLPSSPARRSEARGSGRRPPRVLHATPSDIRWFFVGGSVHKRGARSGGLCIAAG
jgi:hypothetical protein